VKAFMTDNTPPSVVIHQEDLRVAAHAMLLRLPLRTPETRRIARVRELLDVSSELTRLMAAQTHCGRVQCQGSHGTGDLVAQTETLYESLAVFGALVQEIAREYRKVVAPDASPSLDGFPMLSTAASASAPSAVVA
jgi:hypothetical protein